MLLMSSKFITVSAFLNLNFKFAKGAKQLISLNSLDQIDNGSSGLRRGQSICRLSHPRSADRIAENFGDCACQTLGGQLLLGDDDRAACLLHDTRVLFLMVVRGRGERDED